MSTSQILVTAAIFFIFFFLRLTSVYIFCRILFYFVHYYTLYYLPSLHFFLSIYFMHAYTFYFNCFFFFLVNKNGRLVIGRYTAYAHIIAIYVYPLTAIIFDRELTFFLVLLLFFFFL